MNSERLMYGLGQIWVRCTVLTPYRRVLVQQGHSQLPKHWQLDHNTTDHNPLDSGAETEPESVSTNHDPTVYIGLPVPDASCQQQPRKEMH